MERIIENIKEETLKNFGKRITNGKCSFCGKEIEQGQYCDCSEACKKNKYFKRVSKYISKLGNLSIVSDLSEAIKDKKEQFTTPSIFEGLKFDSYITTNESQKNCLKSVVEYKEKSFFNFLTGQNLILLGNYGTGKTMLMSILCNELAEKYLFSNKFINGVDLINKIKSTFSKSNQQDSLSIINKYKNVDFLFLDDIDKINPTEYVKELIYSIVNHRIENELPIVISANHSLEELDEKYFGEATISRIIHKSKIVRFEHQNMRLG